MQARDRRDGCVQQPRALVAEPTRAAELVVGAHHMNLSRMRRKVSGSSIPSSRQLRGVQDAASVEVYRQNTPADCRPRAGVGGWATPLRVVSVVRVTTWTRPTGPAGRSITTAGRRSFGSGSSMISVRTR